MQQAESKPKEKKGSFLLTLAIAMLVALFLRFFIFTTIKVDGPSMQTTLYTGENIIIEKVSYAFGDPERFDVVVCKFKEARENYVKRVIALPGETIKIENGGQIYIDGQPLEGDTHRNGTSINHEGFSYTVEEGHYFVMGDNRENSLDSVRLGTVIKDDIVGRGVAIVWPLDKIQMITH